MSVYETLVLTDPVLSEEEIKDWVSRWEKRISNYGGKLIKDTVLGRRKLAYPVKKKTMANLVVLEVELPTAKLSEYTKALKIESPILRELTTVVDLRRRKNEQPKAA
ncbi:30S ribosomal protein S6 [Elusimicrobiota bacterium]